MRVMDRRFHREEAKVFGPGLATPSTSCTLSAPDVRRKVLKRGDAHPYLLPASTEESLGARHTWAAVSCA
jgi:hypothetical protein